MYKFKVILLEIIWSKESGTDALEYIVGEYASLRIKLENSKLAELSKNFRLINKRFIKTSVFTVMKIDSELKVKNLHNKMFNIK